MTYGMRLFLAFFSPTMITVLAIHPAQASDSETLKQLKVIIEKQQEQLEAQQKAIEELKRKVDALSTKEKPKPAAPDAAPVSSNAPWPAPSL